MVKNFANIKGFQSIFQKAGCIATRASSPYLEDCYKMYWFIRMNKKIVRYGVQFEGILKAVSDCCFLGVQIR